MPGTLAGRDFLSINPWTRAELEEVLDLRAMTELGVPGGKGIPGGG